jgi:hypothetical protein
VLKSSPSITRPKIPPTTAEVKAIVDRYRRGDVTLTDAEIGSLLDAFPSMVQANGSPARHLADILLDNYSKSLVIKESVRRTLVEVREELEGPNPSPLESLLAERAAICWLTVNAYENTFARTAKLSPREADHQQRKIDAAHRRFLSAVKTLATVRKLGLPDIKINVAKNQVNVG